MGLLGMYSSEGGGGLVPLVDDEISSFLHRLQSLLGTGRNLESRRGEEQRTPLLNLYTRTNFVPKKRIRCVDCLHHGKNLMSAGSGVSIIRRVVVSHGSVIVILG